MYGLLLTVSNLLTLYYPRLLSLAWGGWAFSMVLSYMDTTPKQLALVDMVIPGPLWATWATTAVLLIAGALIPPHLGHRAALIGRVFRLVGISIVSMLLIVWLLAFLDDGGRGWVSAKNYAMLFVLSGFTSYQLGRDRGDGPLPEEGQV